MMQKLNSDSASPDDRPTMSPLPGTDSHIALRQSVQRLEQANQSLSNKVTRLMDLMDAATEKDSVDFRHHASRRTIFVRADGDDSNDGATPSSAFRQIRAAVDSLSIYGPVLRGMVLIDVGPGEYEGGIRLPVTRGTAQDDFVRIVGSKAIDGRPTSVVKHSPGMKTGMLVEDGSSIWLEDLKFVGGFHVGVQLTRNVYGWFTNIHVDGEHRGVRGFSISSHCRYYVKGGRLENLTYAGIDEYFNCARSFATVKSWGTQMLIRNCRIGVRAKEGCVGHFDYLTVEDCEKGIELIQNSVANFKKVALKRNKVGLALVNSSSHNESTIAWGTGTDANSREVYSAGASGDLRAIAWSGDDMAATTSVGHRPLIVIANDFTPKTLANTHEENSHELCDFSSVLPLAFFRTQGKHFKLVIFGKLENISPEASATISATIGSADMGEITVGQSGHILVEFDTVVTKDITSSLTRVTASINGYTYHEASPSEMLLAGAPSHMKDVKANITFSAPGQLFHLGSAEMWG